MKAPKFYVKIDAGFFMAGMHGFQTKRAAEAWLDNWFRANPNAKIYNAEIIKA